MKRILSWLWTMTATVSLVAATKYQPAAIYVNQANLDTTVGIGATVPPQVDATVFVNQALFSVSDSLVYETQNTRFYTNEASGLMFGYPGFNFMYKPYNPKALNNVRLPASWVVNRGDIYSSTHFFINATNVVNRGILSVGQAGMLQLLGKNVDLSFSGLRAGLNPAAAITSGGDGLNMDYVRSYFNVNGVTDYYWASGTNNAQITNAARQLRLGQAIINNFDTPYTMSPQHQVLYSNRGIPLWATVPAVNYGGYTAYVYQNYLGVGDQPVTHVVYLPTNLPPELVVDVRFAQDYLAGGVGGTMPIVRIGVTNYDNVLQRVVTNSLFLMDHSTVMTNSATYRNWQGTTRRPQAFELTDATYYYGQVFDFFDPADAALSGANFDSRILFPRGASNVINTTYNAYSALIGDTGTIGSNVSNSPGRIEIVADQLNANQTRMRAEQFISLTTTNLVSNVLPDMDAPVINFDITTTNSLLLVSNFVRPSISRLAGQVWMYSTVWTNASMIAPAVATNEMIHVLIVDVSMLLNQQIKIDRLKLHAKNIDIHDTLNVNTSLLLDADGLRFSSNLPVNASLTLPTQLSWAPTNFPRLFHLTNEGNILLSTNTTAFFYSQVMTNTNSAFLQLAARRPTVNRGLLTNQVTVPYLDLINRGTIIGGTHLVYASNLFNSGNWTAAAGTIDFNAQNALFTGGLLWASSDIQYRGRVWQLYNSTVQAGQGLRGALVFSVTNQLSDTGPAANNSWQCSDGFRMYVKPVLGDLLGTKILTQARQDSEAVHIWAGQDRGNTAAGYSNNVALGHLVLDGGLRGRFTFRGLNVRNALYVDNLEFVNGATNWMTPGALANLAIDPNLTIYFATANVPPTKLNGKLGGRLKWASAYAGPASGTNIFGTLRNYYVATDPYFDSNGNGIPNFLELQAGKDPWDIQRNIVYSGTTVTLSWTAASNAVCQVLYTTNLTTGTWPALTNFTATVSGRQSVVDAVHTPPRYYQINVVAPLP
ncbi:MAG: hypothetical protein WCO56_06820 [Verrucomicrobiota bacterium]